MFGPMPVFGRPRFFFSVPAIALPLKRWYRKIYRTAARLDPSLRLSPPQAFPERRRRMAAYEHNPSRRALLGAAVALPFLPRQPGLDPGSIFPSASQDRWTPDQVRNDEDRKSTRLNSSHANISYAVFCLKKKKYNQSNNLISVY